MTQPPGEQTGNPYVGPRTFLETEGRYFFGRDQEARDLAARIVAERLLLFYAQSGAGKSSLINAKVIPHLRDVEGFQVLPVGRLVAVQRPNETPAATPANVYVSNLLSSLDQSGADGAPLADLRLTDFLRATRGRDGHCARRHTRAPLDLSSGG